MEPTDQPQQSAHGDDNQLLNNLTAGGDLNVGNRVGRDLIGRDQLTFNVANPEQAAELAQRLRWSWPTAWDFHSYQEEKRKNFVGRSRIASLKRLTA
ncbi:MAG: hypothetical protein ACKO3F_01285 [Cyanobium sp.]